MKIGYARVSTEDQNDRMQLDALKSAGSEKIYKEKASGGRWNRPELQKMLESLRPGDTIIIWKLDRLSRSLSDLLKIIDKLAKKEADLKCLTEPVDTTSPAGKMMVHLIGAFAEFERAQLKARTKAGLEAAAKRGKHPGRPKKMSAEQEGEAVKMINAGKSKSEVARIFSVNPSTISRLYAKKTQK